jgi:hypothetical protein
MSLSPLYIMKELLAVFLSSTEVLDGVLELNSRMLPLAQGCIGLTSSRGLRGCRSTWKLYADVVNAPIALLLRENASCEYAMAGACEWESYHWLSRVWSGQRVRKQDVAAETL